MLTKQFRGGVILAGLLLCPFLPRGARAADLNRALNDIADFAERICGSVAQSGSSIRASGEIRAELLGLAKKLADLGIKGSGDIETYEGLVRDQLPTALRDVMQCKLRVFEALKPYLVAAEPPPPPRNRVAGWIVKFSTQEAGGGRHENFGETRVLISTPAAIDLRDRLPPGLSSRNVFVKMAAVSDHNVASPGEWIYFLSLHSSPQSYTQCTAFDVQSDGRPIAGGSVPIMTGQRISHEVSAVTRQTQGMHTLSLTLGCYFQGGQFPVTSIQLRTPSGDWRVPSAGDLTVIEPIDPTRPPGYQP